MRRIYHWCLFRYRRCTSGDFDESIVLDSAKPTWPFPTRQRQRGNFATKAYLDVSALTSELILPKLSRHPADTVRFENERIDVLLPSTRYRPHRIYLIPFPKPNSIPKIGHLFGQRYGTDWRRENDTRICAKAVDATDWRVVLRPVIIFEFTSSLYRGEPCAM